MKQSIEFFIRFSELIKSNKKQVNRIKFLAKNRQNVMTVFSKAITDASTVIVMSWNITELNGDILTANS